MNKIEKKEYYNVIKQALTRAYPIIIKDPQALGLSEDTVDSKIAKAISLLKGVNLPQDSDTLKELADKIVANSIIVPTQEEIYKIFEIEKPVLLSIINPNTTLQDIKLLDVDNAQNILESTFTNTGDGVYWDDERDGDWSEGYITIQVPNGATHLKVTYSAIGDANAMGQLSIYDENEDILFYYVDYKAEDNNSALKIGEAEDITVGVLKNRTDIIPMNGATTIKVSMGGYGNYHYNYRTIHELELLGAE